MTNPLIAREYELPKKPVFFLDEENNEMVRSIDSAAYLSSSTGDAVMYGTNGNLGIRHRGQIETISLRSDVLCSGVYHTVPVLNSMKSNAMHSQRQTGATISCVDVNCLIDGEAGTLSTHPQFRLSLSDGALRAYCSEVVSGDGGVVFDAEFTRAVSVSDLSLWGMEVRYTNFRVTPSEQSLSEGSLHFGNSRGCGGYTSYATGDAFLHRDSDDPSDRGFVRSYSGLSAASSYKVELVAAMYIDSEEWEVVKADDLSEVWQRSRSSGVMVRTTTSCHCHIEYGAESSGQLRGTTEVTTSLIDTSGTGGAGVGGGGGGGGGGSTSSTRSHQNHHHNHQHHRDTRRHSLLMDTTAPIHFYDRGDDSGSPMSQTGQMDNSGYLHRGNTSLLFSGGPGKEHRSYAIVKRYTVTISEDNVPTAITLSFRSRVHHTEALTNMAPPQSFPSIRSMIEERARWLSTMWPRNSYSIVVEDDLLPRRVQLALQYNAFRMDTVAPNLHKGLPQSGCSGKGDGMLCDLSHYLFFGLYYSFTNPTHALALLRSLYNMLPEARRNAERMSLSAGALFPQKTIDGSESYVTGIVDCSRFYVNSDVGYLISLYMRMTTVVEQEVRMWLLELMLETARVWPQLGEWLKDMTDFHLDNIAGPDLYNSSSSGSFYIHLGAKMHLTAALDFFLESEKRLGVDAMNELLQRILMTKEEVYFFRVVANAIVVRRDEQLGVYPVHDNFDSLTEWTAGHGRVRHPLSLNHHPITIFQRKLIDIPEVLLGMTLYDYAFDPQELQRNIDYYLPLSTFDSPHSMAIFAVAMARARHAQAQPLPFLRILASLVLDNVSFNSDQGLDFCTMACSLLVVINGIGGARCSRNVLEMNPTLPAGVRSCSFAMCWHGAVIRTTLTEESFTYELIAGDSVRFVHSATGHRIHLHTGYGQVSVNNRISVPRLLTTQGNYLGGAIFLGEALFHNILEYSYQSWLRVLEQFFDSYRSLHQRPIPPLNPEEFIEKVVYQTESEGIAFSGIKNVFATRGLEAELGSPDDAEIVETRYGLANAKVAEMNEMMARVPPQLVPGILQLLRSLHQQGVSLAIVSYSRNINNFIATNPELSQLFVTSVDGEEAHDFRVRGQPHLDLYNRAAMKLHLDTRNCVVFSYNLDRNFEAAELAQYRMFVNVENPFVSSRVASWKLPELSDEEAATAGRAPGPVVRHMLLSQIPQTVDQLEDFIEGRDFDF